MKKGPMIPNPAATSAAAKRESVTGANRVKANKVIREIANYFKLGKDGASALKAALVRNARDAGTNFKTYVSNFWSVLTAKGGLSKVKKATVLQGDVFAFA